MTNTNPPGLSANTVGLLCFGAGYRSCVISPSECIEWWCTSSASVLNLLSVVTYTCNDRQQRSYSEMVMTMYQDNVHHSRVLKQLNARNLFRFFTSKYMNILLQPLCRKSQIIQTAVFRNQHKTTPRIR